MCYEPPNTCIKLNSKKKLKYNTSLSHSAMDFYGGLTRDEILFIRKKRREEDERFYALLDKDEAELNNDEILFIKKKIEEKRDEVRKNNPIVYLRELGNIYIGKLLLKIPVNERDFEFSEEFKNIRIFRDFRIIKGITSVLSASSARELEEVINEIEYDKIREEYVPVYPPESRFLAQWILDRWNCPDIDYIALVNFMTALYKQITDTSFEIIKNVFIILKKAVRLMERGKSDEKIIGKKLFETLKDLKVLIKAKKPPRREVRTLKIPSSWW